MAEEITDAEIEAMDLEDEMLDAYPDKFRGVKKKKLRKMLRRQLDASRKDAAEISELSRQLKEARVLNDIYQTTINSMTSKLVAAMDGHWPQKDLPVVLDSSFDVEQIDITGMGEVFAKFIPGNTHMSLTMARRNGEIVTIIANNPRVTKIARMESDR